MFFNIIWKEIKQGENIDVYITLLIASFSIVTSIFFDIKQKHINLLMLAMLCLLIVTNLVNRKQLEKKLTELSSTPGIKFRNCFPSEFNVSLQNANSIFISGVSLARTTTTHYSLIEKKISEGCIFKILLVNPDSDGCEMALKRHRAPEDIKAFKSTIITSIQKLNALKKIEPNSLEIRLIDIPLGYGCFAIDPDTASGILFIENYPFKTENGSLPRFTISPQHAEWFDFYKNELKLLWDHSKPYDE
jgi:hypothetical protein